MTRKLYGRAGGGRYRLLSEAEWEYAARAGTTTPYWWGDSASHERANYGADTCCGGFAAGSDRWVNTAPVGRLPVNAFGLYDMHGNVWELTQDCWSPNYNNAPGDGSANTSGECSLRATRGGAWGDYPQGLRSANRGGLTPTTLRLNVLGFRVARTPF